MILTLVSFEFNFAFELAVCLNCLQTLEVCKIFFIGHIQHERWEKTPGWMDGIDPKLFGIGLWKGLWVSAQLIVELDICKKLSLLNNVYCEVAINIVQKV